MMKNRLFLDINVLQSVPSSNINRDDSGSPKTCVYGGVTRARVSSQAQKKAVRDDFKDNLPKEEVGTRTKYLIDLMVDEMKKLAPETSDEEIRKMAIKTLNDAGIKTKDVKGEAKIDALMLVSKKQIEEIARLALDGNAGKKELKRALTDGPSVDLALFGRMVAADTSMNWDACCQVSHAISTHGVTTEYDYFTAVDDCSAEDTAGAGHIGVTEFNSSTLYRYANVNICELYKALGKDTIPAVNAFIKSFVLTMPSGKMNSFANRTAPNAVYIALREDQPVNLVSAFERPVPNKGCGFIEGSEAQLAKYVNEDLRYFVQKPIFEATVGKGLETITKGCDLYEAIEKLDTALEEKIGKGEC